MVDNFHDHNIEDCGSKHLVLYKIDTKQKLKQINRRHYHDVDLNGKATSELKTIYKDQEEMIGKTIGLRSPITCAGKHVCRTCYGRELSEINKDVNTGLVAVLLLTNPLTQKLLSAKHLLTTNSTKVNWPAKFLDYFSINMNAIYLKDPELAVFIPFDKGMDKRDDSEDNDLTYTERIEIRRGKDTKTICPFNLRGKDEDESSIKLLYDMTMIDQNDEDSVSEKGITLYGWNYIGEPMFTFVAENSELTRSLQDILDLIESSSHLGETNYHGLTNKFSDLLIKNSLAVDSVHAEMIISILIREKGTNKRLDFSKDIIPEYNIIRVSKSVLLAPLSVSLAFERLDDQIMDPETYKKDGNSLMDYLYL